MSNMGPPSNKLLSNVLELREYLPCPADADGDFRSLWYATVRDYPADFFRTSHIPLMRQYVATELQLREVTTTLNVEGFVVDTPLGSKPNPLLAVQTSLATQVRACAKDLRISPSAQRQLSQVPKAPAKAPAAPEGTGRRRLKIAGVEDG